MKQLIINIDRFKRLPGQQRLLLTYFATLNGETTTIESISNSTDIDKQSIKRNLIYMKSSKLIKTKENDGNIIISVITNIIMIVAQFQALHRDL